MQDRQILPAWVANYSGSKCACFHWYPARVANLLYLDHPWGPYFTLKAQRECLKNIGGTVIRDKFSITECVK